MGVGSLRRISVLALDGWLALLFPLVYGAAFFVAVTGGALGFDMHVFWEAARAVGHGHSPYDPSGLAHMRHVAQADLSVPYPNQSWAVYPPALYDLLIPLGWLPWAVAAPLGMGILAVMPFLALRVMGVRDWRCYAITYASVPVYTSLYTGAISVALMLGYSLIWRGRALVATTALLVVAKLFLWPLGITLMALDGFRKAFLAGAIAIAIALASWSIIGFADITRYPGMLSDLSAGEGHDSFSPEGVAYAFGLPPAFGITVGLALALVMGAFAVRAATHGRRETALTLMLVAALLASPIVWMHYLSLLFVPLAARRPSFDAAWLLPLVFWIASPWGANGNVRAVLVCWPIVACIVAASLPREEGARGVIRPALRRLPRRMAQT